jgi:hypothetical protein
MIAAATMDRAGAPIATSMETNNLKIAFFHGGADEKNCVVKDFAVATTGTGIGTVEKSCVVRIQDWRPPCKNRSIAKMHMGGV